jgi:hypothetical protein
LLLLAATRFFLLPTGRQGVLGDELHSEFCITAHVLMLSLILVMLSVHASQGYVVEFVAHTACTAFMLHDC